MLQEQYRNVTPLHPMDYEDLKGDEDSLTGAFSVRLRDAIRGSTNGVTWDTRVKKLRGRGPGAPEHATGADMIIEVHVRDPEGRLIDSKGLLAQAKKNWQSADAWLLAQAQLMERIAPGASIAVDYNSGCGAVEAAVVIATSGRRPQGLRPVGELLADEFLPCKIGRLSMFYDETSEVLHVPSLDGIEVFHLVYPVGTRVTTIVEGVPLLPGTPQSPSDAAAVSRRKGRRKRK
jgi:hypothetical protein